MDEKIRKSLQEKLEAERKQTTIKNKEFEVQPINDTPFAILEDKKKEEVWLILGNEKIKQVSSIEEAKIAARSYDWNILGPTIYKIATDATIRTLEQINRWKKQKPTNNKNE